MTHRFIAYLSCLFMLPVAILAFEKELPEEAKQALAFLSSFDSIAARFEQNDPYEGIVQRGAMIIDRPGKARFDYFNPELQLIVNKGKVTFYDAALEQVSYADISQTPMAFLLEKGATFQKNFTLLDAEVQEDAVMLLVRPNEEVSEGLTYDLMLYFSKDPMQLSRIHRIEPDGRVIIISLYDIKLNTRHSDDLFYFENKKNNTINPRS